jgi:hypothetical protein
MASPREDERDLSRSTGPLMTYLATGFIMIWIVGILFLAGRALPV